MSNTNERYTALQRQLEELERIHAESRKTVCTRSNSRNSGCLQLPDTFQKHKEEVEGLKKELTRAQKESSEHTPQFDKLKKQIDALDAKLQETRRQNLLDQAEIKELRVKLRVSENERGHLASKSEESGDAKKSLVALETKRKEELRERDRRIAELEKSIANEQRRNEVLEGKLSESKVTFHRNSMRLGK